MATLNEIGKSNEAIITWAIDAAREQVQLAVHRGEDPDPEWGMGLWQCFQETFPKDRTPGSYDLAIWIASTTYAQTIKAMTQVVDFSRV